MEIITKDNPSNLKDFGKMYKKDEFGSYSKIDICNEFSELINKNFSKYIRIKK